MDDKIVYLVVKIKYEGKNWVSSSTTTCSTISQAKDIFAKVKNDKHYDLVELRIVTTKTRMLLSKVI